MSALSSSSVSSTSAPPHCAPLHINGHEVAAAAASSSPASTPMASAAASALESLICHETELEEELSREFPLVVDDGGGKKPTSSVDNNPLKYVFDDIPSHIFCVGSNNKSGKPDPTSAKESMLMVRHSSAVVGGGGGGAVSNTNAKKRTHQNTKTTVVESVSAGDCDEDESPIKKTKKTESDKEDGDEDADANDSSSGSDSDSENWSDDEDDDKPADEPYPADEHLGLSVYHDGTDELRFYRVARNILNKGDKTILATLHLGTRDVDRSIELSDKDSKFVHRFMNRATDYYRNVYSTPQAPIGPVSMVGQWIEYD